MEIQPDNRLGAFGESAEQLVGIESGLGIEEKSYGILSH